MKRLGDVLLEVAQEQADTRNTLEAQVLLNEVRSELADRLPLSEVWPEGLDG